MQSGHAWYQGEVGHQRYLPKAHGFAYDVSYFWLDLQQLDNLGSVSRLLQNQRFAAFSYRRDDYVPGHPDLAVAVKEKVRTLGGQISDHARIFMLSPLANWGVFFSPLTLYFCEEEGQQCLMLAEVSNTPWNERHYYLVPLNQGHTDYTHAKNFHVSPFNPMDMYYQWQIGSVEQQFQLSITNHRQQQKVFSAWFSLTRQDLTAQSLKQQLIRTPWQNVQIVFRIYWHALKLLIKGLPVYGHKKPKDISL